MNRFLFYPFYIRIRKLGRSRNLAILLLIAAIASIVLTYYSIAYGQSPFGFNQRYMLVLILIDLVLLLALGAVLAKRLVRFMIKRRKGGMGSRFQTRIVVVSSLVATIPAVILAFFSIVIFNLGIQSWFDNKVGTAIEGAVSVARLYLEEHKKIIAADILGMASDLNRDAHNIRRQPKLFNSKVAILAGIRKLPEAIVFQRLNRNNTILARSNISFALELVLENLSQESFDRAGNGELVILTNETDDRVIALVRLDHYFDSYLLVGRFVDNNIVQHTELTSGAANEYRMLKDNISDLQVKFFILFIVVSLLLLLAAVWMAIMFAIDLLKPVGQLVSATEKVKAGDLSVRVPEGSENDEIATLGRAFNRMTEQLVHQRQELISAQRRSAWSDVARRIAHEIKNPLTPIQLSAERLKRKYRAQVENKELFDRYIHTIIRNVGDLERMVEEFARFARIPAPIFDNHDLKEIVHEIVFSREVACPDIVFIEHVPEDPLMVYCDRGQIAQVMTNLLKNCEESIEDADYEQGKSGKVHIHLRKDDSACHIAIKDNGKGFPEDIIHTLTEPYVTTKSKGTGLGLAIAKKIIEDHHGHMIFSNDEEGACIYMTLPLAS